MRCARAVLALTAALAAPELAVGTLWIHTKCPGQTCAEKPDTPMLDWNGERCICRAHPCWFDTGGVAHTCDDPDHPHLVFGYHANGSLACGCQPHPHAGSVYLQQQLCPGEACKRSDAPVLDYDEKKGACICRSNPCLHDDGLEHHCGDARYPILTYSLSKDGKLQCGCSKKWNPADMKGEL